MTRKELINNILLGFSIFCLFMLGVNIYAFYDYKEIDFIESGIIWAIITALVAILYIIAKKYFQNINVVVDFDKETKNDNFDEMEKAVKDLLEEGKQENKTSKNISVRKFKRYLITKNTENLKLIIKKNQNEYIYNISVKDISKGGMFFSSEYLIDGSENFLRLNIEDKFTNIEIIMVRKIESDENHYLYGYGIKYSDDLDLEKRTEIINYFKEKYIIEKEKVKKRTGRNSEMFLIESILRD